MLPTKLRSNTTQENSRILKVKSEGHKVNISISVWFSVRGLTLTNGKSQKVKIR